MESQTSDKEIGIRGIGVLILAFILVYTLFFGMQQKSSSLTIDIPPSDTAPRSLIEKGGSSPMVVQVQEAQEAEEEPEEESSNPSPLPVQDAQLATQGIFSVQSLFEQEVAPEEGMMLLDDTRHREGTMQSAELLGLTPAIHYILKNMDNTHFVYLGDTPPDVADRVAQQGGNLVALSTKNDIDASGLFGDTVIQISLPEYQKIKHKQLLLVQFKQTGDRWFLQVDDEAYERSKSLFKELFAKWYDW